MSHWMIALTLAVAGLSVPSQVKPARPVAGPVEPAKKAAPARKPAGPPLLEGMVKDAAEKPIEGARVRAWPLSWLSDPALSTRTDASGRFRLSLAKPGPHRLQVVARGLAPLVMEKVVPGQSLTLVLARGGAIEGVVRDATNGSPLAAAQVRAHVDARGGRSSWWEDDAPAAVTDARGRYRIEGLGPGLYWITAAARGFGTASQSNVRVGGRADLALRAGGYVFGTVLDREGRPLQGAQARAEGRPGSGARDAARPTDAEGRFEVAGLEARTYALVVRHPDFAPAVVAGVRVEAEGGVEVPVALSGGATVTGRLVGPGERPAAGRVSLEDLEGEPAPWALVEMLRAEAGADGRFRLERVPPGRLVFGVKAPGFAGKRVDASIDDDETEADLGDVELETGLAIRGRVRDRAGTGIPDAQVWGGQRRGDAGHYTDARTESDGGFVLAGLQPGPYHVNVSAPGFARVEDRPVEAGAEGVDVVLAPGGAIAGTVVDESRRPVEAFRVAAEPARGEGWRGGRPGEPKSTADGRFTLEDLAEGPHVLKVEAPGFQPAVVSDVRVRAGETIDVGTVRLARGGVVRGVVVDRAGQPVPFAAVQSRGAGNENTWTGNEPQGTSDATGAFEIVGLRPGRVALLARHPDYAAGSVPDLEVDPAKGPAEARIVLSHGGRIEGWVRRRDGGPVPGMKVSVGRSDGGPFSSFGSGPPMAEPGPDGFYAVSHVPEGSVNVALLAGEPGERRLMSTQWRTVEVRENETAEVSFTVRDILVSGRVTRSGAPVAGARVRLRGETAMMMMMFAGPSRTHVQPTAPQRLEGVAREDGGYELLVDEPGRYWVDVADAEGKRSFPSRRVEVPDAEAYALDLDFGGVSVAGVVVDGETGDPVPRAGVGLRPRRPGGAGVGGSTEADGRFTLEAEEGDYELSARAEGYAPTKADLTLSGDGASGLRLELVRGLVLEGRVLDAGGRPVPGTRVSATAADDERATDMAETLPDGTFRFTSLRSQAYNLFAGSALAGFATWVGATPGEESVLLRLRPGGRVQVTLRDAAGRPAERVYARVRSVEGARVDPVGMFHPSSDSRGVTELAVPAGRLEIEASKEKLKGGAAVTVGEGETVPLDITLAEAAR